PSATSIWLPPTFARRRSSMAGEASMPWTRTPRSASGKAMRPAPMPSSSAGPTCARSARKSTAARVVAPTIGSTHASYAVAMRSPYVAGPYSAIGSGYSRRMAQAASPSSVDVDRLLQADREHLIHPLHHPTDHTRPLLVVRGEGAEIVDAHGKRYFDALS